MVMMMTSFIGFTLSRVPIFYRIIRHCSTGATKVYSLARRRCSTYAAAVFRIARRIQLYPGVDEKYLERAFERIEKDGCPAGEDLMTWFGKLVAAEIIEDAIGKGRHKRDEND